MTPTNPKPGDLAIFVRAENVPEKCGRCGGKGRIRHNYSILGTIHCSPCHGSGTITVTLEGWCNINLNDCDHGFILTQKGADRWVADIIKQLHDKTCPEAIRAQLKEMNND